MISARMLMGCAVAWAAFALGGCQQKPATLNAVAGKVLYHGTILHQGVIVFSPDTSRGESGRIAFGKINADGSYTLTTGDAPGAAAGWYRVTVTSESSTGAPFQSALVPVIPPEYCDPLLSKLQCEVKANRDNHLDFNLD